MEKSNLATINLNTAVLTEIQNSPLSRIPAETVAGLVRRIANTQPAPASVDVTRFNSSI